MLAGHALCTSFGARSPVVCIDRPVFEQELNEQQQLIASVKLNYDCHSIIPNSTNPTRKIVRSAEHEDDLFVILQLGWI